MWSGNVHCSPTAYKLLFTAPRRQRNHSQKHEDTACYYQIAPKCPEIQEPQLSCTVPSRHPTMSSPPNYQIPDLPSVFAQNFQLRANRHCRAATETSRTWVEEQGFLDARELEAASGTRLGLLASLCLSTCDLPQLKLATDFYTLLFHWWDRGFGERSQAVWNR